MSSRFTVDDIFGDRDVSTQEAGMRVGTEGVQDLSGRTDFHIREANRSRDVESGRVPGFDAFGYYETPVATTDLREEEVRHIQHEAIRRRGDVMPLEARRADVQNDEARLSALESAILEGSGGGAHVRVGDFEVNVGGDDGGKDPLAVHMQEEAMLADEWASGFTSLFRRFGDELPAATGAGARPGGAGVRPGAGRGRSVAAPQPAPVPPPPARIQPPSEFAPGSRVNVRHQSRRDDRRRRAALVEAMSEMIADFHDLSSKCDRMTSSQILAHRAVQFHLVRMLIFIGPVPVVLSVVLAPR